MADQIVQLRNDGKWELIGKDNRKATKLFDTQKEAVEYARQVAGNQESGIIVKGRDGKVVYSASSVKVDKAEAKPEQKQKAAPKADAKPDKKAEKEKKKLEKKKAKEAAKKAKADKKAAKKK